MFFLDSGEFRLHLFSPEPPPKVSGFLSEASQSFAFPLDLERGSDGGHDLFEARVAAQIKIETATVPSALLGADAKRGYKGNLLFVGQFAKPRNV